MAAVKKREPRRAVNQPAWITLDGGFAARQCSVVNLSKNGAKILLESKEHLPARLRLAFSRDARTGHACEVLWHRGNMVGVRFVN